MVNRRVDAGAGEALDEEGIPHIVVVEDDDVLRDKLVAPSLRDFGFRVSAVGTARELDGVLDRDEPDIVVLDVGLPDGDGFSIAERLYAQSRIGIVILSGRHTQADRLRGLSNGADAYLAKPVVMHELAATLRNLMRRLRPPSRPGPSVPSAAPTWRLDNQGWCLVAPSGVSVALKAHERAMLRALLHAPGEPVSRETLITAMGGDEQFDPHRIEVLVYRLRSKVARHVGLVLPLSAVRGSGYVFTM
ncbi:response regulator transcription factor [Luteibacter pinisoli]|uniref:Response regulator transcription factor n=1 Tax=Luteibacter pinisoli TaxID=2589080 RepID=A0A4Y5Z3S7_9GAMM|nr:response regulator transcription factor [Luteibacter pinisoli]